MPSMLGFLCRFFSSSLIGGIIAAVWYISKSNKKLAQKRATNAKFGSAADRKGDALGHLNQKLDMLSEKFSGN